jgi:hypothetical protein
MQRTLLPDGQVVCDGLLGEDGIASRLRRLVHEKAETPVRSRPMISDWIVSVPS